MSFPSDDPNTYQGTVLKLIASSTKILILNSQVTELYGSESFPCTFDVKNTLETVEIKGNSKLRVIQNYAFKECSKLANLDLTLCSELQKIDKYAFYKCSSLTSIIFPKSKLYFIGELCFNYNDAMIEIEIPNTVTHIGKWCFMHCKSLERFTFEKGCQLRTLDKWLVSGTKITEFTVPKGVTTIVNGAFEKAYSLQMIKVEEGNPNFIECGKGIITKDGQEFVAFPSSVRGDFTIIDGITTIRSISFSQTKLTHVTFPKTLKTINSYAFLEAPFLKSIIIPDSVTYIDAYAFKSCKSATTLKLSKNITSLNICTFMGCAFAEVEIPHGVTQILGSCFAENTHLVKIVLPSTIETLGGNVFPDNPNLEITFAEGTNMKFNKTTMIITDLQDTIINQYMGAHENFKYTVPSTIKTIQGGAFFKKENIIEIDFLTDSQLTHIYDKAFIECVNLRKFVFPDSLQSIGSRAFEHCASLTNLEFGTKLTTLGEKAFYLCSGLESANFYNSQLKKVEISAFENCTSLVTVRLPLTIANFGQSCFSGCTSLSNTEIHPEATIETISHSCFRNTNITSFAFNSESTIETIDPYAFSGCANLASIKFCPSITSIKEFAFEASGLTKVSLTKEIAALGDRSFINCESLTSIEIPQGSNLVEDNFGLGAFANCYKLSEIKCGSENFGISVGALFSSDLSRLILFPPASKIAYFPIPEQVTKIGNCAFQGCNNLRSVIISSINTTYIGIGAFEGCKKLHYINIPKGITYIGSDAFKGCKSLVCGVDVEDSKYISELINVAKLPPKAIRQCNEITVDRCSHRSISIMYIFGTLLLSL